MKFSLIPAILVVATTARASSFACQILTLKNVSNGNDIIETIAGSSSTMFIDGENLRGFGPGAHQFPISNSKGDAGYAFVTVSSMTLSGKPWTSVSVASMIEGYFMPDQNFSFPSDSDGGQVSTHGQFSSENSTMFLTETARCLRVVP